MRVLRYARRRRQIEQPLKVVHIREVEDVVTLGGGLDALVHLLIKVETFWMADPLSDQ